MKLDSQANQAFHELRRQILTAQIAPGTRLKEDYWAEKLGVGRMAVRESLTRLLGEGLVKTGEKGGYLVEEMTAEDISQIRELREILELAAVQLAIDRITPAQLLELDTICDDFTTMIRRGYFAGACEADLKFHETLLQAAGNQRLLNLYHYAHIPLFHQKLGQGRTNLEDYDQTDREHRQLVDAIRQKNADLAGQILRSHFKRGESLVLDF